MEINHINKNEAKCWGRQEAGGKSCLLSGVALNHYSTHMLKSRGRAGGGGEPLTRQPGNHLNKGKINILLL